MAAQGVCNLLFNDGFDRDLGETFFRTCSPATLYKLKSCGHFVKASTNSYMSAAFDINKHFSFHLEDPAGFRLLQQKHGVVVSGSNVLQFLGRTRYPDSDLDTYVRVTEYRHLIRFIISQKNMRYHFVPSDRQPRSLEAAALHFDDEHPKPVSERICLAYSKGSSDELHDTRGRTYPGNQILEVFTFKSYAKPGRTIQVVVCDVEPLACVLLFHSSTLHYSISWMQLMVSCAPSVAAVMNLITFKAVYSLYPFATFEERKNYVTWRGVCGADEGIFRKMEARGWETVSGISPAQQSNHGSPVRYEKRWMLDGKTWIFPLDVSVLGFKGPRTVLQDSAELASWDLTLNTEVLSPEVRFMFMSDPRLMGLNLITNITFSTKVSGFLDGLDKIDPGLLTWNEKTYMLLYWSSLFPNFSLESIEPVFIGSERARLSASATWEVLGLPFV